MRERGWREEIPDAGKGEERSAGGNLFLFPSGGFSVRCYFACAVAAGRNPYGRLPLKEETSPEEINARGYSISG